MAKSDKELCLVSVPSSLTCANLKDYSTQGRELSL